jgi:hypothetical protein
VSFATSNPFRAKKEKRQAASTKTPCSPDGGCSTYTSRHYSFTMEEMDKPILEGVFGEYHTCNTDIKLGLN